MKVHQVSMIAMAEIAAVDWMHVVSQIRSQFDLLWNMFRVFVETYNTALLAPLIWIMLLLFLLLVGNVVSRSHTASMLIPVGVVPIINLGLTSGQGNLADKRGDR